MLNEIRRVWKLGAFSRIAVLLLVIAAILAVAIAIVMAAYFAGYIEPRTYRHVFVYLFSRGVAFVIASFIAKKFAEWMGET